MAQARRDLERIGRVSDDLVRVGPFRFGWDAALEFIPGVGEVYSLGAGAWLLAAGRRACVPGGTLAAAAALVGARTAIGAFDLSPWSVWWETPSPPCSVATAARRSCW